MQISKLQSNHNHRVVFTGDIHLHEHENYAQILSNGRNSRLQIGVDCLKQAADLAKGGVLVIAGDLFHHRTHLTLSVIGAAVEALEYAASVCEAVLLVPGNHDQFLRNGEICSVHMFRQSRNIIITPPDGHCLQDKLSVYSFPHTVDQQVALDFVNSINPVAPAILVLHQGLKGAWMNSAKADEDGITTSQLRPERFEAVILGHYHRPQNVASNVMYVSSPYQVDWGEAGDQKRFLVWENGQLTSVPVMGMPEFKRMDLLTYEALLASHSSSLERDFIELEVSDLSEARKLDLPPNVLPVRPVEVAEKVDAILLENFSVEGAVKHWLDARDRPDLYHKACERMKT